ncbi:MAG: YfhO family protein, partial [Blastocatellia bacterium]
GNLRHTAGQVKVMPPTITPSSERLSRIAVALALFLLPLVYFFPAALGKVTLAPGDGWAQIIGIRILIGEMIARGELPLWNPYSFAGMPLLGSIQPGTLYPPTWLFAFLSPQTAMNALVITTYHLAIIGTYLYSRRIGCSRIGAIISAITFAFGGYMIAHLGHTNRINAAAWLPWILLSVEELHLHARWRWVTAGALFIALQIFAGDPQTTLYTGVVAGAYALFTWLFRAKLQSPVRFLAALAAMAVCGALLSMIQLLPGIELLRLGDRAGIDYHYFSQFSFPPGQTFELFFPYFFGGAVIAPYRVPYWGKWSLTETCGYVGMAAWLLGFAAVFANWKAWRGRKDDSNRLIWFWALAAVMALLLAFGSYLPFGLNKLLHYTPIYNLFRAPGRHLMEFTFAIGVLAGLGATALSQIDRPLAKRVLLKSILLLAAIIGAGVIVYRFFGQRLAPDVPPSLGANALSNPEIYFPIVFFGLSVAALLIYARRWSALAGAVLIGMLFLDLMSWGFFYEWRAIDDRNYNVATRLADPPTVKFIKEREPDLNSFRIVSHSPAPYGLNQDLLDYPNVSIARGLQSVNGYDPARLRRMAEVAGQITLDGVITEPAALAATAQGFNLLNAKYLLNERSASPATETVVHEGISFDDRRMDLKLERWAQVRFDVKTTATELAIISAMENPAGVTSGAPVLNIRLRATDGQMIERQLLAGRDTFAWTPNSAAAIPSWNKIGFRGQGYLARLKFDRAEIESVEFDCPPNDADLIITRASLFDAATNTSRPLDARGLPPEHWRKLAEFGEVEIYENLKAMPRAWFASRAVIAPGAEVLRTIRTGRLTGGAPFDPAETVLLDSEFFWNRTIKTPPASSGAPATPKGEMKVTAYGPQRIELQTANAQPGFLVLSEIYYPGWEAWVDGQRAPVERVNFTLRGVELSPGEHRVEFVFRSPSFRNGAAWSLAGVMLLLLGAFAFRRKSVRGKS